MKQTAKILFFLSVGIILIPSLIFFKSSLPSASVSLDMLLTDEVKIYLTESDEIKTLSRRDFLYYSLLACLSPDASDEAIKAQAVLLNSYIARERLYASADLKGADISDDATVYQRVLSKDEAASLYPDLENESERLYSLIDSVYDTVLTYNSVPVLAAYFEGSFGATESAEDIWNEDIPYLQSVECPDDAERSELSLETSLTSDELKALLEAEYGITLSDQEENWLKITSSSENETPLSVIVDSQKEVLASELYLVLGLSSQHFEITLADGSFTFKTSGVGHLVGVSLTYAEAMAQNGDDFGAILNYFYKGCDIVTI